MSKQEHLGGIFLKNLKYPNFQMCSRRYLYSTYFGVCYYYLAVKLKLINWGAFSLSSFFILDVITKSQKDQKLFSATYILCNKQMAIKR